MKFKDLLPLVISKKCKEMHIDRESTDEFNIINFQEMAHKKKENNDFVYDIIWETTNFGKDVLKKFEDCEVSKIIPIAEYVLRIEVK